jgi:hypothetical protein
MSWQNWFKVGIKVAEDVIGPGMGAQKLGVAVAIVQAIAAAFAAQGTLAMGDAHDNLMIVTGVQDTFNQMKASGEQIGSTVGPFNTTPSKVNPAGTILGGPLNPTKISLVPPAGSPAALAASAIAKSAPVTGSKPAPQYSLADIIAGKHLKK